MKILDEQEQLNEDRTSLPTDSPDISVFLPVFNEEPNLLPLHAKLDEALKTLKTQGRSAEIVYVDDIIDGVVAAIHYDRSNYEIFNLGESRTVELNELISLLEKELDAHAIIDRQPPQPGDVPQTYADISKARASLGYDPKTQIEEGLRRFVEWFRISGS